MLSRRLFDFCGMITMGTSAYDVTDLPKLSDWRFLISMRLPSPLSSPRLYPSSQGVLPVTDGVHQSFGGGVHRSVDGGSLK